LAAEHHWAGALFLLAVLSVGPAPPPWVGDIQTDFLPELNAYVKLIDTRCLLLLVLKYHY